MEQLFESGAIVALASAIGAGAWHLGNRIGALTSLVYDMDRRLSRLEDRPPRPQVRARR